MSLIYRSILVLLPKLSCVPFMISQDVAELWPFKAGLLEPCQSSLSTNNGVTPPIVESNELIYSPKHAAIEETKAVFPPLRQRIRAAILKLEEQLETGQENGATDEEIAKAKDVIDEAKAVTV